MDFQMRSPLGPTLVNVFFDIMKKNFLQNVSSEFKPTIYRRYLDDTFLLFHSTHHIEKFLNYLNRQHKNIRFTFEIENENSISFLDIQISRHNNKITTSVYPKLTFIGVTLEAPYQTYINTSYLLHRALRLCSNF